MTVKEYNTTVELYSDNVYRFILKNIRDEEKAKDIVQDTFMAGLKSANNYRGDASERTWLISILKRKIIKEMRYPQ